MKKFNIKTILSEFFDDRDGLYPIDTIIIHSMHNPLEDCSDRFSPHECKTCLDVHEVSCHYLIDIEGNVWNMVPEEKRAWHAGVSKMPDPEDAREGVNHFSIGIELIGSEDTEFTAAQYDSLALLTEDITSRHFIKNIYSHADIAPERKTDPWGFDWERYKTTLQGAGLSTEKIKFSSS